MLDNGSIAKITVDGTDCPIQEPSVFSGRWYSHKFKGPGLRYEVGVCIQTGWIVWKNGPYPCGSFPDIRIARDWLYKELRTDERYIADAGYRDGGQHSITPSGYNNEFEYMAAKVRARHENINARIKIFNILSTPFRNELNKHGWCFHAIINMLQLEMETTRPMRQIYYDDTPYM
jgi:DDE superfamily endonuclease